MLGDYGGGKQGEGEGEGVTGGWVGLSGCHESESSWHEGIQKLFLVQNSIMVETLVHVLHLLSGQVDDPFYFWMCSGHSRVHHHVSWPAI